MDKDKLNELKELAEKATPGPWIYDEEDGTIEPLETVGLRSIIAEPTYSNDAAFIAAANPQTVLELIAEIERREKEADWLAARIIHLCDDLDCYCTVSNCDGSASISGIREAAREAVGGEK